MADEVEELDPDLVRLAEERLAELQRWLPMLKGELAREVQRNLLEFAPNPDGAESFAAMVNASPARSASINRYYRQLVDVWGAMIRLIRELDARGELPKH